MTTTQKFLKGCCLTMLNAASTKPKVRRRLAAQGNAYLVRHRDEHARKQAISRARTVERNAKAKAVEAAKRKAEAKQ